MAGDEVTSQVPNHRHTSSNLPRDAYDEQIVLDAQLHSLLQLAEHLETLYLFSIWRSYATFAPVFQSVTISAELRLPLMAGMVKQLLLGQLFLDTVAFKAAVSDY